MSKVKHTPETWHYLASEIERLRVQRDDLLAAAEEALLALSRAKSADEGRTNSPTTMSALRTAIKKAKGE